MAHSSPPPTPVDAPPAHSGAVPPPIPSPAAQAPSTSTDGAARIVALKCDITILKGMVNQMAANMVELMALLHDSNRLWGTSQRSTRTLRSRRPMLWRVAKAVHLIKIPPPPATLPTTAPPPPSDPTMLAPPPVSISFLAPVYAAPPPMVFPEPNSHAPAHTSEPSSFQVPPPHISFSYPAPPPINIPTSEPATPT
ncbi:pistil-specific extensin-like protein [Punica granatum]|uniref:Pistil-specific extensin-like protein n=1 Tax=Punica granatum TaxID=22663 RepID=A0A6P8CRM0_PUNGR|nr:pistil-specific extensin-like protein [Punica granatum]